LELRIQKNVVESSRAAHAIDEANAQQRRKASMTMRTGNAAFLSGFASIMLVMLAPTAAWADDGIGGHTGTSTPQVITPQQSAPTVQSAPPLSLGISAAPIQPYRANRPRIATPKSKPQTK
jgi:hypothetical protein